MYLLKIKFKENLGELTPGGDFPPLIPLYETLIGIEQYGNNGNGNVMGLFEK